MEKVKIMQEQADALETVQDREKVRSMIIRWHTGRGRWVDDEESLNELELDNLIRALYIGYEVEPEYPKERDWVKCEINTGATIYGQIDTTAFNDVVGNFSNGQRLRFHKSEVIFMNDEEIAKEKKRRWWAKHGRDAWDIREDDILEYLNDLYIVDSFDSEKVYLKSGIERKTDYAETFDFVKKHFKVVAFSDDRKDV